MYWGHEFDLSGPRDVIGHPRYHMIPHRPFPIGGPSEVGTKPLSLTVFEIFSGEFEAMHDMTSNDLYAKVKVIHFHTNRFLIYDFL